MPLRALHKAVVIWVCAIGSADSFVQGIQKMETFFVDRLNFKGHHRFHSRDIEIIRGRLEELADKFDSKPIVVVTEKDYDRDPEILKQLSPFKVFVLYSKLRVMSYRGSKEDEFKGLLQGQLGLKLPGANQY
ncbi:hypothetical protein L6164_003363 [Bauhinia variegata]|uniref:Uncharacterized protein n=1 Tax=Bauhinia variegata TaxID=167791 RepID=A0ACB9Q1P2_BAUVA|nr:hypothetical protein L6164_003363 [Bauhinia variegata]